MDSLAHLVRQLDAPMLIVTTAHDGERAGCLVGFHSQCSIEPELYAVWLSTLNRTYRVATAARFVAVHVIDRADHDLAQLFGGTTGDDTDKFSACAWVPGPGDVPLLERCPSRMVLERVTVLTGNGDHDCFIGRLFAGEDAGRVRPLRLSDVSDIDAGHPPRET